MQFHQTPGDHEYHATLYFLDLEPEWVYRIIGRFSVDEFSYDTIDDRYELRFLEHDDRPWRIRCRVIDYVLVSDYWATELKFENSQRPRLDSFQDFCE